MGYDRFTNRGRGKAVKNFLLIISAALTFCSPQLLAQSVRDPAKNLPADYKTKTKNGKTVVHDKSKPVRQALEDWYSRNMEAFKAKDVSAIMALRTADFHTITPDGRVNSRIDMETRTRRFLAGIDHFISQDNQIGTIEVEGNLASAEIKQKTVRMQRFPGGSLHKVESNVVQRETWKQTAEGWKLSKVDNIRDGDLLVDGNPYNPTP